MSDASKEVGKSKFESPEAIAEEDVQIQSDVDVLKGTVVRNQSQKSAKVNNTMPTGVQKKVNTIELQEKADPTKVANGIVMEINNCAGQLFQLSSDLVKLVTYKPKRVYKFLLKEYQEKLEDKLGENIYRQIIKTPDFSFASEDFTGEMNEIIA